MWTGSDFRPPDLDGLWQISRKMPFLKNFQNKLHLLIVEYYK